MKNLELSNKRVRDFLAQTLTTHYVRKLNTRQLQPMKKDFLLAELPQPIKDLLHAAILPWLNSLAFCTIYDPHTAERVLLKMDKEQIQQVVFYRIVSKLGVLTVIEIIGFPDISDEDIRELLGLHNAQLATVNRFEQSVKPEEDWQPTDAAVFCKTYVALVDLPPVKEDYLKKLGKNKHAQLPKYWRRINRLWGDDFELRGESTADIQFDDIITLEHLNRARRSGKGKGVDSDFDILQRQNRRWVLTQKVGFLMTLRYKGNIIGGGLTYIYADKAFFLVVAHDPIYGHLHIGTLVVWKMIECLIEQKVVQFNLLWGRQVWKTQFLGVEYPWTIHTISKPVWLGVFWKNKLVFDQFRLRVWRYVKTKMRAN